MQITLRRASALQLAIKEKINENPLKSDVIISRFDDPGVSFQKASFAFDNAMNLHTSLTSILYEIRKKVSHVSQAVGVADALADMACCDKFTEMCKPLVAVTHFAPDDEQLADQHDDLVNEVRPESHYSSRRESINVSLILEASVEKWKADIASFKREKQRLSDKLLDINANNFIDLDTQTVETLTKYGLL
jgi:hypothetical protein